MPAVTRRRAVFVVIAVVAIVAAWFVALPYVHGLSFVIRAADLQGTARRIADADTHAIEERDATIPRPSGPMRARVYRPVRWRRQSARLVPGPHPFGIDEAGFVRLARALAASGVAIVTPDIPELSRFELTAAIPDAVEQAALWLASESGLAANRHIALIGISFSGGFSIVAAARPSIASRVESVVAIGGHDDLPRVLRFLCTGSEPYPSHQLGGGASQPFVRQPNDLGVTMILIGVAARVVPRAQVEPLRDAVRRFLTASALDTSGDKELAANHFLALRQLAKRMPEPSATLLRYVNDRDVVHLGARLLPYVSMSGGDPSLSVSKSPRPAVPIFLLHATDDTLIPSIESEYLAEDLRGHARVRLLLNGMPRSGADRAPSPGELLPLAGFWGDLLFR